MLPLLCLVAADKKPAPQKQGAPDVEIQSIKVQREPGLVALEGWIRNCSTKPFKGLILFFEFLESDGKMITRKSTMVSEVVVRPGEEQFFEAQTVDPVRAVHIRLDAEDKEGRYLKVDKRGPYAIE
jgi:hypothetical protein